MPNSNKENRHNDKQEQNMDLFLQSSYSRRTFIKQVVAIGTAGLIGPVLLTACGSENVAERSEAETGPTDQTSSEATGSEKCEGSTDLPASDIAARQAVNYVDESPHTGKDCANCRFFKQPPAGVACGGCEIIKGLIAAEGYCNAWVAQS